MLCLASDAAGLLVFAPPGPRIAMDAIGFRHRPCVARRVPATEVRGPLGPRLRWSLWMVGRWPHLKPRFLEGAALWYPPFAGVSAGSGPSTRGPYAAASPRPSGRSGRNPACGPVLRGLVGAIGWSLVSPPVRRGCRDGRALSCAPSLYLNSRPLRGVGPAWDAFARCAGRLGRARPS